MTRDAAELVRRLAREAEAVCRHYLSNGRRVGNYWQIGDVIRVRQERAGWGAKVIDRLSHDLRRAFPDRDYSGEVGPQTRLFADLGLASIDAVVLAERIEQFYGRRLPFGPFLAGLRARGADDLVLGELVEFLQQQFEAPRG